jgi:hypothetical protein
VIQCPNPTPPRGPGASVPSAACRKHVCSEVLSGAAFSACPTKNSKKTHCALPKFFLPWPRCLSSGYTPPRSVGARWAGARSRSRRRLASRRMNLRAQSPNQNRTLPTSLFPFPFPLLLPAQIFLFLFSLLQIFFRQKGRIKSDSGSFSEPSLLHRHLNRCHLLDGNRFLLLPFFLRLRSRGENFNPALFPHSQLRL